MKYGAVTALVFASVSLSFILRRISTRHLVNAMVTQPYTTMVPIVIAANYDRGEYTEGFAARHEAVLADVGRIAAEWALA